MKFLTVGFLFFISFTVLGQQYIVFAIKGEVLAEGQPLLVKSVITDETKLTFRTPDGEVHVISPQKGKLIISAGKAMKNDRNEFLTAVKNAILPPAQYRTTSTRSISTRLLLDDIYDLKAFFQNKVLTIDTTEYEISGEDLIQDELHYFEIQYQLGEQIYSKVLPGQDIRVYFSAPDIFSEDEHYAGENREVKLYYTDRSSGESEYISTFTLVWSDAASIAQELQLLYEFNEKNATLFLFEEALPFLEMRYGKPNPEQVKGLLETHLGLKF